MQRRPADLQDYIDREAIKAELITDVGHTPTVPAAAAALGIQTDQIIKTLLFLIEKPGEQETAASPAVDKKTVLQPVLVISNGERRIDKKRLAAHLHVPHKRVKFAAPEVVLDLLGYPAGGVPPFGHKTGLPVILDAAVVKLGSLFDGVIYGGGGDDYTMMKLTVAELLRVLQPEVVAVSGN